MRGSLPEYKVPYKNIVSCVKIVDKEEISAAIFLHIQKRHIEK